MCHPTVIEFGKENIFKEDVNRKRVLEVGSRNINGTLKHIVVEFGASEYIGTDLIQGDCVDIICSAEDIVEKFGKESFDVVVSAEMLEHVKDWKKVISNIKQVCKKRGIILITTRSYGMIKHEFPGDYWRYEVEDMNYIFSDCKILKMAKDAFQPGVFIKVTKPDNFIEKDLCDYKLYNMQTNSKA